MPAVLLPPRRHADGIEMDGVALEVGEQGRLDVLGATLERLRETYGISLSALACRSGVAASLIREIERNERDPTSMTLWRLSQAIDDQIQDLLLTSDEGPFIGRSTNDDIPVLISEDGKCRLAAIGWVRTAEWLQLYDVRFEPGGIMASRPHQQGSIESLSVLAGVLEISIDGLIQTARQGETIRYRCDRCHTIRNATETPAHAVLLTMPKAAVMD